jgi:hypothetical protein
MTLTEQVMAQITNHSGESKSALVGSSHPVYLYWKGPSV